MNKFYILEKNSANYLRYLVIALDSSENRDKFTAKHRSIVLTNKELPIANKRKTSSRKRSFQPQPLLTPKPHTSITRSAQHQGNALTNISSWAGPRNNVREGSQTNIPSRYTTLYPKKQTNFHSPKVQNSATIPQSNPSPNRSASPQNSNLLNQNHPRQSDFKKCDLEYRQILEATNLACITLSQGLEYPDSYVNCLNKTLKEMGHPLVTIPNAVIDISKEVFIRKNNKESVRDNIPVFSTNLCPPLPNSLLPSIPSSLPSDSTVTSHSIPSTPPQAVISNHLPPLPQPVNSSYSPIPDFLQVSQIPIPSVPHFPTQPFSPTVPFYLYPPPTSTTSQYNPSYLNLNLHAPYQSSIQNLSSSPYANIL